jgi:hypothetical protein
MLNGMRAALACTLASLIALCLSAAGAASPAALALPTDVAVQGELAYVAEYGAGAVSVRHARDGTLVRLLRGAERPIAVAVDRRGRVYAADAARHQVVVWSPRGALLRRFGGFSRFPDDYGRFDTPLAIAVLGERIYVGDRKGTVQAFSLSGRFLFTWGRRPQDRTSRRWLGEVTALAVLPDERLAVADAVFDEIRIFAADGRYLAHYGPHVDGWRFDRLQGLAWSQYGLWVADGFARRATHNNHERLLLVRDGRLRELVGERCARCGRGVGSSNPGGFYSPHGLAAAGEILYVADTRNNRIQLLRASDGAFLGQWR